MIKAGVENDVLPPPTHTLLVWTLLIHAAAGCCGSYIKARQQEQLGVGQVCAGAWACMCTS